MSLINGDYVVYIKNHHWVFYSVFHEKYSLVPPDILPNTVRTEHCRGA
ncbi:hypothetical protein [Endozoicomonas numazuensis]|nr:hypothetical protein [Endozoicomonas numazuensis]